MANALTILRILLSLSLLALPALSPSFFVVLALAGATDMIDGTVARRTGTASEFGAKLDSVADLILILVCLVTVLPLISVPTWLWVWVGVIFFVKVLNVISGFIMEKRLVLLHTNANKATGLLLFFLPFAIPFFGVVAPAIPTCAMATFAAVQEGHIIRTRQNELTS